MKIFAMIFALFRRKSTFTITEAERVAPVDQWRLPFPDYWNRDEDEK